MLSDVISLSFDLWHTEKNPPMATSVSPIAASGASRARLRWIPGAMGQLPRCAVEGTWTTDDNGDKDDQRCFSSMLEDVKQRVVK